MIPWLRKRSSRRCNYPVIGPAPCRVAVVTGTGYELSTVMSLAVTANRPPDSGPYYCAAVHLPSRTSRIHRQKLRLSHSQNGRPSPAPALSCECPGRKQLPPWRGNARLSCCYCCCIVIVLLLVLLLLLLFEKHRSAKIRIGTAIAATVQPMQQGDSVLCPQTVTRPRSAARQSQCAQRVTAGVGDNHGSVAPPMVGTPNVRKALNGRAPQIRKSLTQYRHHSSNDIVGA